MLLWGIEVLSKIISLRLIQVFLSFLVFPCWQAIRRSGVLGKQVNVFKEEVKSLAGVEIVSVSTAVPNRSNNTNVYWMDGRSDAFMMTTNWIDYDFLNTYRLELEGGRSFNEDFPTDHEACLINNMAGHEPRQYYFMEDDFERQYSEERQSARLAIIFSIITIIIAALGLFGLTSFTLQQRTKEIGIRKTMGSSTGQIFILIAKDIFILLGVSTLIAWPIIYFIMKNWLENFHYRVQMTVWPFTAGCLIAVIIALLTLSYKTWKAAKTNPANSLQYE